MFIFCLKMLCYWRWRYDMNFEMEKIGRFIAGLRKENGMTQEQLAEKLGISDRAVSKWERSINMPDHAHIPQLCHILGISINELFSAEKMPVEEYMHKAEENLLALQEKEERQTKLLLLMEVIIGVISTLSFLVMIMLSAYLEMPDFVRIGLIAYAILQFAVGIYTALMLERVAGYYKCPHCGNKYVPDWRSFAFSMHINRTRRLKCPACGKKGWHKKIVS